MKKIPNIPRNREADNIWRSIKEDSTKIYQNQTMLDVFLYATDSLKLDHFLELNKTDRNKINGNVVYSLLLTNVFDKQGMETIAEELGKENLSKLSADDVYNLLNYTGYKPKMAEVIGKDNISKLDDHAVYHLLSTADWQRGGNSDDYSTMPDVIIQYKKNLNSNNIYCLLKYCADPRVIAQKMGKENLNKISNYDIYRLLKDSHSSLKIIAEALTKELLDTLTEGQIFNLLLYSVKSMYNSYSGYAGSVKEMGSILGRENLDKLTEENVVTLLIESGPFIQEMAEVIGKDKINKLDADQIQRLIADNINRDEMIKVLGKESLDKLSDEFRRAMRLK